MDSFDHSDLDPVSLKIMNVFNRDDLPKLRKENQMLRNKLRQFRESDNKKTQDLKVRLDKFVKKLEFIKRRKTTTFRRYKKNCQTHATGTTISTVIGRRKLRS